MDHDFVSARLPQFQHKTHKSKNMICINDLGISKI